MSYNKQISGKNITFVALKERVGIIMKSLNNIFPFILAILWMWGCSTSEPSKEVSNTTSADSISSSFKPNPSTSPKASENATSGEIYISVDEALKPIIQAEIDNFEALYQNATVHPIYLPGEEAIQAMLISDSIRITVATRKLNEKEEQLLKVKTIPPDYSEVAKEGVSLLVHPSNQTRTLTNQQLKDILTGKIASWKQLNSNFDQKNDDIVLVFDNAKSGIIAFFRDSILVGESFSKNLYALNKSEEVLDYVQKTPNAIGFIGISWISDMDDRDVKAWREKIKLVYLEKSEKSTKCAYEQQFFGPFQSFLSQNCYPLTRTIYTIGRESGIGLGTGFVAYMDGPSGQRIFHKSGLATVHTITRRVKFPPRELNSTTKQEPINTTKENETSANER